MRKTTAALVDELGALRAEIAALREQERHLKIAVSARLRRAPTHAADGAMYRATLSTYTSERIDSAAVKALLSPEALAGVTKSCEQESLRITARLSEAA